MPSMIAFAMLPMASSARSERALPKPQLMSPHLQSATSDSGPEYESAQITELGDAAEGYTVVGWLHFPIAVDPAHGYDGVAQRPIICFKGKIDVGLRRCVGLYEKSTYLNRCRVPWGTDVCAGFAHGSVPPSPGYEQLVGQFCHELGGTARTKRGHVHRCIKRARWGLRKARPKSALVSYTRAEGFRISRGRHLADKFPLCIRRRTQGP